MISLTTLPRFVKNWILRTGDELIWLSRAATRKWSVLKLSVEKDARKAGRDFLNSLTPEKFEKYKSKAGVGLARDQRRE